jgi:hypothetical protein
MSLSAYCFYKFSSPLPGIVSLALSLLSANKVSKSEAAGSIHSASRALKQLNGNRTKSLPLEEGSKEDQ